MFSCCYLSVYSGHIVCVEPIEVVSYKIGVCRVSAKGKECRTEFERLSYNGKTSVVLCKPHTGRMHQIRVHLQFLGKRLLQVFLILFYGHYHYKRSSLLFLLLLLNIPV